MTPLGPGLGDDAPVAEAGLRRRHDLGAAPIVLTVSAKRPHKNLERLLEAIARVPAEPVLVVPGYETVFERPRVRQRAGERVRFLGWVDDGALEGLYRAAKPAPSSPLAEGFGPARARGDDARGSGRLLADRPVLEEVAGDAARYFDPLDPGSIADTIQRALADDALRRQLGAIGSERARSFEAGALRQRETLACYERAAG